MELQQCQTHSLPLVVNGHEERIALPVFDSTEYDKILGLDWLMKHNPRIDWNTQSLIFSDPNLNVCVNMVANLHATTPAVTNDELYQLLHPPWPMSEFPEVFDMKEQMQLPTQREGWDFDVKFKANTPLPRCRLLFKLPRHQQDLEADFIQKELKSGKIRLSNSPLGANLFFVPKNDSTTEPRPCIDYRDLNNSTLGDRYPSPPISGLIQALTGGDLYAKFDWQWAYILYTTQPVKRVRWFWWCRTIATQTFLDKVLSDRWLGSCQDVHLANDRPILLLYCRQEYSN
ncbi:hypothetical protein SeLEV6574_g08181 [Synchytrium endobioticum]|uniref:Reverse transcriptase domain-containing protein n=1 Tax=Synchytrium endobioticum TaxID=286115 RepID=A0A507C2S4_9FUNG|nr:hypothetical protein SeLEV6574_g08181 [Synchytrium endobioticum]